MKEKMISFDSCGAENTVGDQHCSHCGIDIDSNTLSDQSSQTIAEAGYEIFRIRDFQDTRFSRVKLSELGGARMSASALSRFTQSQALMIYRNPNHNPWWF